MDPLFYIRKGLREKKKLIKAGYAYAEKLYKMACEERDKKGYRENLGYDLRNMLQDKIAILKSESYQEYCAILEYFDRLCAQI